MVLELEKKKFAMQNVCGISWVWVYILRKTRWSGSIFDIYPKKINTGKISNCLKYTSICPDF